MDDTATRNPVDTAAEVNLPDTDNPAEPAKLTDLDRRSWKFIAKKVFREFNDDQCVDLAAGLTFYAVLALFPALLALVALLGLIGSDRQGTDALMGMVRDVAPGRGGHHPVRRHSAHPKPGDRFRAS